MEGDRISRLTLEDTVEVMPGAGRSEDVTDIAIGGSGRTLMSVN